MLMPPDLETKPTEPRTWRPHSTMFSIVPAASPMRKAPAWRPPTVAGPMSSLLAAEAAATSRFASDSGTPSAMTATTRSVGSLRAAIEDSKAERKEAKLMKTSAVGWSLVAAGMLSFSRFIGFEGRGGG